jgi:hypothetical protein
MNSMLTTPRPPRRLRIRRKYWSVIPAIGARIRGGSIGTLPIWNMLRVSVKAVAMPRRLTIP